MSDTALIESSPLETRAALLRDGHLEAFLLERPGQGLYLDAIYLARIVRLAPGLGGAFVDLGDDGSAFLDATKALVWPAGAAKATSAPAKIAEGQLVAVRVSRLATGRKGVRVSSNIRLAGRHVVLEPGRTGIRVSTRITDAAERERLSDIAHGRPGDLSARYAVIFRTAAAGATAEMLDNELAMLADRWERAASSTEAAGPGMLHKGPGVVERILNELDSSPRTLIFIEGMSAFNEARHYCRHMRPELDAALNLHTSPRPLFETHGVEEDIRALTASHVPLPSGGEIVIERTEALVSIDVNSGAHADGANPQANAMRTNLEAVEAVAHHVRLRNIGGIVVVDLIHMTKESDRQRVATAFKNAVREDPATVRTLGVNRFCLLQFTRQNTGAGLTDLIFSACDACDGSGHRPHLRSMAIEIMRKAVSDAAARRGGRIKILAAPEISTELHRYVDYLQARTGRPVEIVADATSDIETFEVRVE